MKPRILVLLIATGLLGAGAGWWFTEAVLDPAEESRTAESPAATEMKGRIRPDFSLGGIDGDILTADRFDGQVLLINFWATWCKPCRAEMPMLAEVHDQLRPRGFEVLGVALDEVDQAREFLEELEIRYPNAVGTVDVMAMSAAYGNRAGLLPYSVLIDRHGVIRWVTLGELERESLESEVRELL